MDYARFIIHIQNKVVIYLEWEDLIGKDAGYHLFMKGKPEKIRVDNGPEFIAEALQNWTKSNNIELKFI